jgi:UDP-N-acetylmuramoyl-L-alanyl-D-glutamate--2,6-diaminopimelate ligase
VTGTNGKTSVTQLVAQALDLLGQHCGIDRHPGHRLLQ